VNLDTQPFEVAEEAAHELLLRCKISHFDLAIVLGSGWREAASALGEPLTTVRTSALPGFVAPTVPGHEGAILSLRVGEKNVAIISGRVHLYEGNSPQAVAHPVRTVVAAGASSVVLTNAAGGLRPDLPPGSIVVLSDHVNLTACSPLEGPAPPEKYGPRFVDLSNLYDAELRARLLSAVPSLTEGVYAGVRGPQYETPAEIRMMGTMGCSLVGMSTVLEAIAAKQMGAKVVGLSLVTNFAAGVTDAPLDHHEVLEAGRDAEASLATVLGTLVTTL